MMHVAGMTEAQLRAWAKAKGASDGAARSLARTLVARFAGREPAKSAGAPPAWLLDAARAEIADALPSADAASDPDGTVRFAVRLADGALVETVLIHQPETELRARGRFTVCLSSQVGCARGCVFCETGRLGLQRNLISHEIATQFAVAARFLAARGQPPPTNAVFMGMGEPLDNLDEVLQAAAVLSERAGWAVPERRVTVSTVGIVPKMDELYARSRCNLAVSLHAIEPAARLALLPVARRYPLAELRAAIARSPRTVLLQWTLIAGANDRDADADQLAGFCRGLDVRVNLIPLNPGPRDDQRAPPLERCREFQKRLLDAGVRAMLRLPHGQAVGGACGQLAGARRSRLTV
jgi:23S rRNA (adenine2503-C2)-methyltransferase